MKVLCPFCYNEVEASRGKCCPNDGKGNPCPSNKNNIPFPPEVFDHEPFPIIVVGGQDAGKSVYLSALAWRLNLQRIWGAFWSVKEVSYSGNRFDDIIGDMFHDQPYKFPDPTKPEDLTLPLLFSVTFKRWSLHPCPSGLPRVFEKRLLVCFTDPAGEHFRLSAKNSKELKEKYPILQGHAKAAIAIMDPSEVNDDWRNQLSRYRGATKKDRGEAAESLASLSLMPARERRNLPVAICLAKLDELTGEGSPLSQEERFDESGCFRIGDKCDTFRKVAGKISLPDLEWIDKTTRGKLFDKQNHAIFDSLGIPLGRISREELWSPKTLKNAAFPYHAFFGVSAIGKGKTAIIGGKPKLQARPEPFRVLDPFLWILWQHGYVGATEMRTR